MKLKFYGFSYLALVLFVVSCSKPNNYTEVAQDVIKEYRSTVSTTNINSANSYPAATSLFVMKFFSDSTSVNYDIYVDSIKSFGDRLTGVTINLGDPLTDNGQVLINLTGRYSYYNATGVLKDLRKSLVDTLMNDNIDKYINVITSKAPEGLMRGQLNTEITFASNVDLTGNNVNPVVNTSTTGRGLVRVLTTINTFSPVRKLYSKVEISNDEASDPVTNATINTASGTLIDLITGGNFNQNKVVTLSESEYSNFLNDPLYLNITSANYKNGKLRGRIR